MITAYTNLNEKEAKTLLKKHGIKNRDIEKEFAEAKANHNIISPMFNNFLYTFVLDIKWHKRKKYNIYQQANF